MNADRTISRSLLAIGAIALGVLGVLHGDFAMVWQSVPASYPARTQLAYVSGVFLLLFGIGLFIPRMAATAAWGLFIYVLAWLTLLKVLPLLANPLSAGAWLGVGEISLVASGCLLQLPGVGETGQKIAQTVFAFSLFPIGLAHLVYLDQTAALVPAWLPFHSAWAALTGIASFAAGAACLFSILPRLAATLEAAMMSSFTLLVWGPGVLADPANRFQWTGLWISWLISAAAWVVADSYRGMAWRSLGRRP